MPRYAITEKAGRFVAGQTNIGVGTVLTLTEKQAEHDVRLGSLRPFAIEPEPEPELAPVSEPEIVVPELSGMTVRDLSDFAERNGINLPSGLRKAEIIDTIERALQTE